MGEEMKRKSCRFPDWMLQRITRERERFHPFCEDDSHVIRMLLQFMFQIIDAGMLEQILEGLQGRLCGLRRTLSDGQALGAQESRPEEAGLRRVEALRSRLSRSGLSRLRTIHGRREAGSVVRAWGTSFPNDGFRRPFARAFGA